MKGICIEEIVGALHAAREAHLNEVMETLVGQESDTMETISQTAHVAAPTQTDEGSCTGPSAPEFVICPLSEAVRRQAQEDRAALRALREKIRARRGGNAFTEAELAAALHEARAAHDRGE